MRFAKISRRLNRCRPYDSSYCRVYQGIIAHLDLLLDAGSKLISFISLICAEGDSLAFDSPAYLKAWDYEVSNSDAPSSTVSSFNFETETDSSSSPSNGCSSFHLTPQTLTPTLTPTPPPHHVTPTWKLNLAHKYATEQLYVGATELEVFAKTLGYARLARLEILNTKRSIVDISALADNMQAVFDIWAERCERWEMTCLRGSEVMRWEE